jgi:hypothetical protein
MSGAPLASRVTHSESSGSTKDVIIITIIIIITHGTVILTLRREMSQILPLSCRLLPCSSSEHERPSYWTHYLESSVISRLRGPPWEPFGGFRVAQVSHTLLSSPLALTSLEKGTEINRIEVKAIWA